MAKPWFAPKRYGYGTGAPITWEGWAVFVGFFAATFLLMYLSHQLFAKGVATTVELCGIVLLIAVFVAIARAKTAGGWRWRNGEGP